MCCCICTPHTQPRQRPPIVCCVHTRSALTLEQLTHWRRRHDAGCSLAVGGRAVRPGCGARQARACLRCLAGHALVRVRRRRRPHSVARRLADRLCTNVVCRRGSRCAPPPSSLPLPDTLPCPGLWVLASEEVLVVTPAVCPLRVVSACGSMRAPACVASACGRGFAACARCVAAKGCWLCSA